MAILLGTVHPVHNDSVMRRPTTGTRTPGTSVANRIAAEPDTRVLVPIGELVQIVDPELSHFARHQTMAHNIRCVGHLRCSEVRVRH